MSSVGSLGEDGRVEIPLRMLDGNLATLLEHDLECTHISLKLDPGSLNGVILMIGMTEDQKVAARAKGFRTRTQEEENANE